MYVCVMYVCVHVYMGGGQELLLKESFQLNIPEEGSSMKNHLRFINWKPTGPIQNIDMFSLIPPCFKTFLLTNNIKLEDFKQ